MKYKIFCIKDDDIEFDETFETEQEAETFLGIELTQMETEGLKREDFQIRKLKTYIITAKIETYGIISVEELNEECDSYRNILCETELDDAIEQDVSVSWEVE